MPTEFILLQKLKEITALKIKKVNQAIEFKNQVKIEWKF